MEAQRERAAHLRLACRVSATVVVHMACVPVTGLVLEPTALYGLDPPLGQSSRGGDVASLLVGPPSLLGVMGLARRGSLIGLLLWPGALFHVLYTYALDLLGAPSNALFFAYVAVVTRSAYTLMGIVARLDGDAVRRSRFCRCPCGWSATA